MNILRRVFFLLLWISIPSAIEVSLRTFFDMRLGVIPKILLYAPFFFLLRATWTGKFDKKIPAIPTASPSEGNDSPHHAHRSSFFHHYDTFILCPGCGSLVPQNTRQCDCGYKLNPSLPEFIHQFFGFSRNYFLYIIAAFLFIAGIGSGYYIAQSRMHQELTAVDTQLSELKREHADLKQENKKLLRENASLKSKIELDEELSVPILTPATGQILYSDGQECIAPFSVVTRGPNNYYVKLKNVLTSKDVISFFVRGGETADLDVPLGTYFLYYAVGDSWQGEEDVFGESTRYFKTDDVFDFYESDGYVNGWTVELYAQNSGNLSTESIDPSEF